MAVSNETQRACIRALSYAPNMKVGRPRRTFTGSRFNRFTILRDDRGPSRGGVGFT